MCEWLSCGDWCDVRLMCGGRSFNAHRAVLASVSSFLRRILLSCPMDESPIFIFLPEFDVEALSSILYYIYNGEVSIPNHKLKSFLDTANAMEIFIEHEYKSQSKDNKKYCFESNTDNNVFVMENYNICQLRLFNAENGYLINAQKRLETEKLNREIPADNLNLRNNSFYTFKASEENVPDLRDLTSISGCRQKQSWLRDLFIEAYSKDGNVNGQTPLVPAISNKEYRTPTSAFFSNANRKHPGACGIYSDAFKRSSMKISTKTSILNYLKHIQDIDYGERNKNNLIFYTLCKQFNVTSFNAESEHDPDSWKDYSPLEISSNFSTGSLSSHSSLRDTNLVSSLKSVPALPKVTILNEVLQSPWHPRQPNSYRPFRKKVLKSICLEKKQENEDSKISMDKKNNNDTQLKGDVSIHDQPSLSNHLPELFKDQDFSCNICQEAFKRRDDYNTHMRRHSPVTRYSCGECQKTFSQLRNFKYHMSVHRGTKEFAATCTVCGKHFNDRGYLSNHMKIHRNRKEYKCASCPKSFNQRVAFNMHVRIHTGIKPHVCEECGKAFSRKMLLKQHQRTHSGERPYACAHCDKRFADRSNMTLHLRLHTGVKPFSCTLCSKSFTKKHHLKSHLNYHTGAKPYSCPRCNLAFTQSSNMRTHFKKCMTNENTGVLINCNENLIK